MFFRTQADRFISAAGFIDLNLRVFQQSFNDLQIDGHVVHDENFRLRRPEGFSIGVAFHRLFLDRERTDRRRILDGLRQNDFKAAAVSRITIHGNGSLHQGKQLFCNGKSQPRSLYGCVLLFIHPPERIKEIFLIFLGDADPGIKHLQNQIYMTGSRVLG